MHVSTVLYPNPVDLSFDMAYYLATHMPLVQKTWAPYGLRSWSVIQFQKPLSSKSDKSINPADNDNNSGRPQFSVQATLVWDDAEQCRAATMAEESKPVFADVANFSNTEAVFVTGDVVGSA